MGFHQPRRWSQSDRRGLILGEIPFFDRYGTEPSKPVKLACPWQMYENGAGVCRQTQAMKIKHSGSKDDSGFIQPPAYPIAGNKLFERIGAAVGASRGYSLSNIEFARLMGRSESTASHWFGVYPQPHLVSFFCLLEQLAPQDRHRVLDELCRDLPLLDHPRLRHNPVTVGVLKNLVAQDVGLTLITGGTAPQRTFILTALGHAFCRTDRLHRTPAGLDLHEPSWFVPVGTLLYATNSHRPGQTLAAIRVLWPTIRSSKEPLILLNGIWSAAPELQKDIVALAGRKHVIVADQDVLSAAKLAPGAAQPLHTLRVSTARENLSWLVVDVESS